MHTVPPIVYTGQQTILQSVTEFARLRVNELHRQKICPFRNFSQPQSATNFALNGLFDVFRTSKTEKITFPPPSPPRNVVPPFELPLENKKHPNFEWRGHGRGVDSYVSEVTLFEYNVSTILSPIAVLTVSKKHLHQHNIFDHFSMYILSFSRFYPRHYCGQTSEAFLLNLDINNYLVIFQRVFLSCQKLGPCS